MSAVVAGTLQGGATGCIAGRSIIGQINNIVKLIKEFRVYPVYREANCCVDLLAGMGCSHQVGLVLYGQAPAQLAQAFQLGMSAGAGSNYPLPMPARWVWPPSCHLSSMASALLFFFFSILFWFGRYVLFYLFNPQQTCPFNA